MRNFIVVLAVILGRAAFAGDAASYLDLNLSQNRYLGEVQNSAQLSNYTFLSGDLALESHTQNFNFKINPVAQDAVELQNELYFGVPEAYVQTRDSGKGLTVTLGRQKRDWSHLDEEFNLGVWQPQLRWDYLAPKQEGLIGMFFDLAVSDEFKVTFFTSPLFLPDQGPNFQLTNGQFTSSNRWFMQPQSQVCLFCDRGLSPGTPLYFQIDRPSNEQIIMNSSFALGLSYKPSARFWWQANYAYKPMNQIHLGIDCPNCVNLNDMDVTAVIHPIVVKHSVVTMESGFDGVDNHGYLSLTGDFPNKSDFPSTYEESALNSMVIAGAAYEHFVFSWLGVPSWLKVAYMRAFDMESKDQSGLVASDQVQSSLDRYPYREVAAIEWKLIVRQQRSNHLQIKSRYSYSVPEKGGWLSAGVDWGQGPVSINMGLDFLGSDLDPNSPNAGLYSRYRANNRVFGGVSYVF